ncbi:MAG: hypothetical protein EOP07_12895 [Proteobacteria bacterium]|nr:MAG: hypothetical protein EOP07_12895 [Pseudomonadota bacterium]
MKPSTGFLWLGLSLSTLLSCKHSESSQIASSDNAAGEHYQINREQPRLCTAIRGNGPLIWAHFASMAKILETEGLVEGVAGGSSASISSFLYESMLTNPAIWKNCSSGACSSQEVAARLAFMMKTLPLWLDTAKESKEAVALAYVAETAKTVKSFDFKSLDVNEITKLKDALGELKKLLLSSTIRGLLNKDFLDFITPKATDNLESLSFRAQEAKDGLVNFGKFSAKSSNILYRPGLLDFKAVAALFASIGDFYAGAAGESAKAWPSLLGECSPLARDKTPWDMKGQPCEKSIKSAMERFLREDRSMQVKRGDSRVGDVIPAIASTAILIKGQEIWEEGQKAYFRGQTTELKFPDGAVRFGYASNFAEGERLKQTMPNFGDKRSSMYQSLGAMRWVDFMSVSPAEPGLASALTFKDAESKNLLSFGGWSDLSPVMVLKAANCQKVIYVTREGEDSEFAQGVAGLVGLNPIHDELFSLGNNKSSFSEALNRADAVYCTKWNDYNGTSLEDIKNTFTQAYRGGVLYKGDRTGAPVGCAKIP